MPLRRTWGRPRLRRLGGTECLINHASTFSPVPTALRLYDNSRDADPADGEPPTPRLVLQMEAGRIVGPPELSQTPDWAKPIVAAASRVALG
jgi:hypothetical protein